MTAYASRTDVAPDRSRAEIEHLLTKHGATGFLYGWQERRAAIGFELRGRKYRFVLTLPDVDERRFTHTAHKDAYAQQRRSVESQLRAHEQAVRSAWRELALLLKAKLVAVSSGIVSFEEEFMPYALLVDGRTVATWLAPQLDDATASGRLPPLLPPGI